MTILVILLGMMVGLAWFMPDDRTHDQDDSTIKNQDETGLP